MDLDTTWGALAAAAGGRLLRGEPADPLRRVTTDTRADVEGSALWALRGERHDAHAFLDETLARRADGWVVRQGFTPRGAPPARLLEVPDTLAALQRFSAWHRRRFSVPVVGVTGSNGKTTVKEMLRSALGARARVCATRGNFNNEVGLPLSLLELGPSDRFAVFELAASREGDIRLLASLAAPTAGVLTNIGPAHLESFGDIERVFRAKCELLEGLPAQAPVALNADDPRLASLLPRLGSRAWSFGSAPGARVRILGWRPRVELQVPGGRIALEGEWLGRIHAYDAAAAAAAALALGLSPDEVQRGLADFRPAPLRFAPRRHASGTWLLVDAYNANPASMRAGIETFLESAPEGERVLVLGDMKELGPEGPRLHRELGEMLAGLPLAGAYLAGELMAEAASALGSSRAPFPVLHAARAEDLLEPIRRRLGPGVSLFFKASRTVRLEDLVERL